jgi:hypothetical protein
MILLSLGYIGLQGFYAATVGLLVSSERGRQAFLDEGHHTRRDSKASALPIVARISHRLAGTLQLLWLILGSIIPTNRSRSFFYDVILGCLGIVVTWTATRDFPHKHLRNVDGVSGTLSQHAIVTQDEMIEHLFYQVLNLLQSLYLHAIPCLHFPWQRLLALCAVTAPWLVRNRFPVHPFSQNWKAKKHGPLRAKEAHLHPQSGSAYKQGALETVLYRIKKWQYLLYKHVLLHGINLIVCLQPHSAADAGSLVYDPAWRLYWGCLNASYVMEFFLQSMVKRKAIGQFAMLSLNRWLMLVSTIAASLVVWRIISVPFVLLSSSSLVWNLVHRKHDFSHVVTLACAWRYLLS